MSALPLTEAIPGITRPTRRGRSTQLLGEVLVDLGFAGADEVDDALQFARSQRKLVGQVLVERGIIDAHQLARAVAERFGLDHLDLGAYPVDVEAMKLVSPAAAKRYGAVPVGWAGPGTLLVAMADPANVVALDDIGMLTGLDIVPAIALREDIDLLVARLSRLEEAVEDAEEETPAEVVELVDAPDDDAPVIKLVNHIVSEAIERGASDVHFVPHDGDLRVQFRIDGVLSEGIDVPQKLRQGVVARVKIMADLDIAERRAPQDGRFAMGLDGRQVDIRVVTLPLVGGESIVMRILDRSGTHIGLEELGMLPAELERFTRAFRQAYGAVLVTGPTGSGKTTTVYGALNQLNTTERSIVTIEDPVEYRIEGLRQMQVNPRGGVTFSTGLRSMMRADPDVVMVGEIRDRETAQIAVESALTGHLVLSTLHTNDAPTAVTRLVEMGIEPFLVGSAIDCVVAQRLARRLCPGCKRHRHYPAEVLLASGWRGTDGVDAFEPVGCGRCGGTGYKGRVGLYEVMTLSEEIRALALSRGTAAQIGEVAARQGMRRLREDGLEKVRAGATSLAEIARVAGAG